jgi:hypothetical protein
MRATNPSDSLQPFVYELIVRLKAEKDVGSTIGSSAAENV